MKVQYIVLCEFNLSPIDVKNFKFSSFSIKVIEGVLFHGMNEVINFISFAKSKSHASGERCFSRFKISPTPKEGKTRAMSRFTYFVNPGIASYSGMEIDMRYLNHGC